ncbi:MAG: PilZ domain-containing protein [Candidatus Omnitrophica bacterium]|nr:PilZ domain-containing protein [Candidatus Omnitrophota bacterium]
MEQKRKHMRVEDLVEVEFVSVASEATVIIKTKTRDIGAGGVKVYLNHRIFPGTKLQLNIKIPNEKTDIQSEAEVISADLIGVIGDKGQERLYETRLKFIKMEAQDKNKIIRHVYGCRRKQLIVKK